MLKRLFKRNKRKVAKSNGEAQKAHERMTLIAQETMRGVPVAEEAPAAPAEPVVEAPKSAPAAPLPKSRNRAGHQGIQAIEESARRRQARLRDASDGQRDYPNTRPKLAYGFIDGLVRWLAESDYDVISYNDLAHPFAHGEEGEEFQNWIRQAQRRNQRGVLLQYDVDARPDVTERLLKTHMEVGVPGNAMIFNKKVFDFKLKREGIVEVDESYKPDFAVLEAFQRAGGVVAYHCNAFDLAGGDHERAIEIFHEDIAALRKHLDIKYFSMHGGHVTADGSCNGNMKVAPYLDDLGLTWVHNGHSVNFHATWADGSASNPRYRTECGDCLDFILGLNAGERARLLFHPQYYHETSNSCFDFPVLQEAAWVRETQAKVEAGRFDGTAYWRDRAAAEKESIDAYQSLFEPEQEERPVFINGMSRSGTTLLVSIFDAHPKGAMAYESYPRYLTDPSDGGVLTTEEYLYVAQTLMNYPEKTAFELLRRPPLRNMITFAAVSNWTGMTIEQIGELLRAYLMRERRIDNIFKAMAVVAATARYKVRAQGAEFWGTKCQGDFASYFEMWPNARLAYIFRNGLDVLASQKTNGAFNPDPAKLGKNWRTQYDRVRRFQKENQSRNVQIVQYESLARDPEAEMRRLCAAFHLEFDRQMIRQHEVKSTLAENPRGQLSAERVQQPIDASAINRWREVLDDDEIAVFMEACGGERIFEENGLEWRR